MEKYLMDTNVVSDYLSASFSPKAMTLMDNAMDAIPNISVITQIELLCWNTDATTTKNVNEFMEDCLILDISQEVIRACVLIRKGKKIKTPDAIIAATALAYDYTIITNNEKDFNKIRGLRMVNPHKI